ISQSNSSPSLATNSTHHLRQVSQSQPRSTTFTPSHIKLREVETASRPRSGTRESKHVESLVGLGENDFSGRRWVWMKDPEKAFVKAEVLLDTDGLLRVKCEDGSVSIAARLLRRRSSNGCRNGRC